MEVKWWLLVLMFVSEMKLECGEVFTVFTERLRGVWMCMCVGRSVLACVFQCGMQDRLLVCYASHICGILWPACWTVTPDSSADWGPVLDTRPNITLRGQNRCERASGIEGQVTDWHQHVKVTCVCQRLNIICGPSYDTANAFRAVPHCIKKVKYKMIQSLWRSPD